MHELLNIDENQNYMLLSKLLFHISAKTSCDQGTLDQEILSFSKRQDLTEKRKLQNSISFSYPVPYLPRHIMR